MNGNIKTRICINCEGNMTVEDPFCPYCGQNQDAPLVNNVDKSFAPPYRLVQPQKMEAPIPIPIYKPQEVKPGLKPEGQLIAQVDAVAKKKEELKRVEEPVEEPAPAPLTQQGKIRSFLIALIFTMSGSTFLLFGLSLFLFGKEELLTVHWKSSHWYLYLAASFPLLLLGWRFSNHLTEDYKEL